MPGILSQKFGGNPASCPHGKLAIWAWILSAPAWLATPPQRTETTSPGQAGPIWTAEQSLSTLQVSSADVGSMSMQLLDSPPTASRESDGSLRSTLGPLGSELHPFAASNVKTALKTARFMTCR